MQRTYYFDEIELDTGTKELRVAGQAVPFSSLSFALLEYLLRHRERVVSAEELRDQVWRGVKVSDGSLRQAIWELRQALGDCAQAQRVVRTVRGQGYRLVCKVQEREHGACSRPADRPLQQSALPEPMIGLVGRDSELRRLHEALARAQSVCGRALVVMGGAGVGKSRLVEELRATTLLPFVQARGEPDDIAPALAPWRTIVHAYLSGLEPAERARYQHRLPAALSTGEPSAGAPCLLMEAPGERRAALFEALASLLAELACARPSVILVEDVHWLDADSLLFLAQLAGAMDKTRSLLLLTCREPAHHPLQLTRALRTLRRCPGSEQIELGPLTQDHVKELLRPLVPGADLSKTAEDIYCLGRGSPLLTLNLAHVLAARTSPLAALTDRPEPLLSVLQPRLAALGEPACEALGAAAVWGLELTLGALAALLDEPPAQTLARLDQPLREGVLVESSPARFRFGHPLYQEVAYAGLSRAKRARLHRAALAWLETQGPDAHRSRLGELTRHAVEAAGVGAARAAVQYSVRSAEHAYQRAAFHTALLHADRALTCLELVADHTPQERLSLELMRAQLLRASGADTPTVNRLFLSLAERAELLGQHELFGQAVLGYTGHQASSFSPTLAAISVDHGATALVERALRALPQEPSALRVLLQCSLLYLLVPSTERARRDRLAETTLQDARVLADSQLLARALTTCLYACAAPDQRRSRISWADELVLLTRSAQLSHLLPDALATRAMCLLSDLQVERARRDAEEARERAATHPAPSTRARSNLLQLADAFLRGDLRHAEELSRASLAASPHDLSERALFTVRMASVGMLQSGLTPEIMALHEQMLLAYPDAVSFRCVLAGAYALQGQHDQAARHFDFVAEDDFGRLPQNLNTLSELTLLVGAAVEMKSAKRAQQLYERLLPHARCLVIYAGEACPAGVVAMYLADLAITMGAWEAAEYWLDMAEHLHERFGAELFQAFCMITRARFLNATRPDQPEAARRLLRSADAFGRRRGVSWLCMLAQRASGLELRRICGTGHRDMRDGGGPANELSPRVRSPQARLMQS